MTARSINSSKDEFDAVFRNQDHCRLTMISERFELHRKMRDAKVEVHTICKTLRTMSHL